MVRRSPSPNCPPTGWAVWVRHPLAVGAGVWVWGPITVPLACMPCGGCVPWGWWGAVPGGEWPATVVRGVWCQALSLPRPPVLWGGNLGSATLVSLVCPSREDGWTESGGVNPRVTKNYINFIRRGWTVPTPKDV